MKIPQKNQPKRHFVETYLNTENNLKLRMLPGQFIKDLDNIDNFVKANTDLNVSAGCKNKVAGDVFEIEDVCFVAGLESSWIISNNREFFEKVDRNDAEQVIKDYSTSIL